MSITTVLYHIFKFSFGVAFIVVVLYLWRISKLWFGNWNDQLQTKLAQEEQVPSPLDEYRAMKKAKKEGKK